CFCYIRERQAGAESEEPAPRRDPENPGLLVAVTEFVFLVGLRSNDGDCAVCDAGFAKFVDRVLCGIGIRIQSVDRAHGLVLQSAPLCSSSSSVMGTGCPCPPTFSSQIEIIGTAFEKSVESRTMAANVAKVIRISTGCGG